MNLTYHGLDSCIKFFKCHKNLLQNLMYNNNYIMIKYIRLPSHSMRLWGTLQERTCMYMKHEIYTFSMNSHMLCTYFIKKIYSMYIQERSKKFWFGGAKLHIHIYIHLHSYIYIYIYIRNYHLYKL